MAQYEGDDQISPLLKPKEALEYLKKAATYKFQMNVLYLLVALGLIAGMAWMGLRAVRTFEDRLKVAEARETLYLEHAAQLEAELKADKKLIADLQEQQEQVLKTLQKRDRQVDALIAKVGAQTAPEQIQDNAEKYLGMVPELIDKKVCFEPEEAATLITFKIDRDRLAQDLIDMRKLYEQEQQKTKILTRDLEMERELRLEAEEVAKGYKKVAKKGKWKKFLSGVRRVGEWGAVAAITVLVVR